jgi:hypothetical protein
MSDIDQLEGLELIKAFAEALGYSTRMLKNTVEVKVNQSFQIWDSLPTYLVIREFDRIKPEVVWKIDTCWLGLGDPVHTFSYGPDFATAVARLVVRLDEEKVK